MSCNLVATVSSYSFATKRAATARCDICESAFSFEIKARVWRIRSMRIPNSRLPSAPSHSSKRAASSSSLPLRLRRRFAARRFRFAASLT